MEFRYIHPHKTEFNWLISCHAKKKGKGYVQAVIVNIQDEAGICIYYLKAVPAISTLFLFPWCT